jgi:hypothetical protein
MKEGEASMLGRPQHPQLPTEHLHEWIDVACQFARIAYSDDETVLAPAWFANPAYVFLVDSRTPAFATAQRGPSKPDLTAHSLLAARATLLHADAVR